MTTIQRYHRLRHERDHYQRRYKMLHSITIQKRDELENLMNHINQLLVVIEDQTNLSIQPNQQLQIGSYFSLYDHGDHSNINSYKTFYINENKESDDDDDDDDDPLLQRLKSTKPSRLKTS